MIRKISQRAAVAVALSGVAAGALALQPPDVNSEDSIKAWTNREKVSAVTTDPAGSWQVIAGDPQGFIMMGGVLAAKDASGIAKVGSRMEMFAPSDVGAGPDALALSVAQLYDANCANSTIQMTSQAIYSQRNLTGLIGRDDTAGPAEPVAGHPLAQTVQQACAARPAAPVIATGPASVNYQDRGAVTAWQQRNIQLSVAGTSWQELGGVQMGMLYYGIDARNSESRNNRRVRVRQEFFDAVTTDQGTVRSIVTDFDLNCLRTEARRVRVTAYGQHNLSGPANVTNNTPEEYRPAADVSPINAVADDICRDVSSAPSFR